MICQGSLMGVWSRSLVLDANIWKWFLWWSIYDLGTMNYLKISREEAFERKGKENILFIICYNNDLIQFNIKQLWRPKIYLSWFSLVFLSDTWCESTVLATWKSREFTDVTPLFWELFPLCLQKVGTWKALACGKFSPSWTQLGGWILA